jgi:polysaccharide biosynthesis/export protein
MIGLLTLILYAHGAAPAWAESRLPGEGIPAAREEVMPDRSSAAPAAREAMPDRSSAAPAAREATPEQSSAAYRLGAGDRVQIDIFDVPEYSGQNGQYQVLVDGSLSLPLVGDVAVQGLTLKQLSEQLSQQYGEFLKRPVVTVTLLNSRPLKIGIAGEVARPGAYLIPLTTQEDQPQAAFPTLTGVLKLAGGIVQTADIRRIEIHRPQRSGPAQVIPVDLWQLLQTGDLSHDPSLRDGDAIVVPTATALTAAEMTQLAGANFSPDTIQVNVAGEVRQPGVVKVPPNTPLNTALLAAGGFDRKQANTKSVELIRLNPNGTVTRREVAIDFTQGVNEKTNPALRNQDVIVVNRSGAARFADTVGTLLRPFTGILSVFGLFF